VLFNAIIVSAAEIATATITSSQIDATDFQYNLVLNDIGTTNVGTFWFAWIPGEDFMATSPVNILSPANWTSTITGGAANDGFAIRWVAQAGFALTPGNSLSGFGFESATTPAEMTGASQFFGHPHVTTSVIYSAGPFSDAGSTFIAAPVPEPSMLVPLLIAGGCVLRRRYAKRGVSLREESGRAADI
jgi:hypothetical protein